MALRKPLVVNSGEVQQLQSGDTLDAPQAGGDDVTMTNGNAGALVIGTPVYVSGNNTVDKAKADASGTSKGFGCMVPVSTGAATPGAVRRDGVLAATTGQWDTITGGAGGLVANTEYYLDPATAGKLTSTPPSTVGQYLVKIGRGISTTELDIAIEDRILL
jgi:hypothetical protein